MPRKGSAKADTVDVQVAQSDGEITVFDPYGEAGPAGQHVYPVSGHSVSVHPAHEALVAEAGAGEPYETEAEAQAEAITAAVDGGTS